MENFPIKPNLIFTVFQLANKLQIEGDKISDELTLKQWFLLLLLYDNRQKTYTVNNIAARMGVSRQSIKKMVVILESNGYLNIEKSNVDSRALAITPTQKAKDFFRKNKLLGKDLVKKVCQDIDEDKLIITLEILNKMQANLKNLE